jgi:hypothetical protein
MIRKLLYNIILYAGIIPTILLSACSESSLSPIDELGKTIYDPVDAQEGSADAIINAFYDKYESKILYDFNSNDLAFGWSLSSTYWYAPVKGEYKHYIKNVSSYLNDEAFQDYPDEFIKKYLPYRIFLVDSICDSKTYEKTKLKDVMELKTHGIAIAHIGKEMDKWGEENWETLRSNIVDFVMSSIANSFSNNNTLTQFDKLRPQYLWSIDIEEDPEGEFTAVEYSIYSNGMSGGQVFEEEELIIPAYSLSPDLGQYISFILKTPKSKMDRIFTRFSLVKQRSLLVASFIKNELEMDPVAMHNTMCPDDPYPADYFNK